MQWAPETLKRLAGWDALDVSSVTPYSTGLARETIVQEAVSWSGQSGAQFRPRTGWQEAVVDPVPGAGPWRSRSLALAQP